MTQQSNYMKARTLTTHEIAGTYMQQLKATFWLTWLNTLKFLSLELKHGNRKEKKQALQYTTEIKTQPHF